MTKTLIAVLLAATFASPAWGEDDRHETLGTGLGLMKVAPELCGTSASAIETFTEKVKMLASLSDWDMKEMERIGDAFVAKNGHAFQLVRKSLCETVASLLEIKFKVMERGTAATTRRTPPMARIKAACGKRWPDNYVMQEYCIDQQINAWKKVEGF